jgi:hypothetical protein
VIHIASPRATSIRSGFGSGGGGGALPSKVFFSRAHPGAAGRVINARITQAAGIAGHLALILLIRRNIFGLIDLLARKGVAARIRFDTLPRFR